VPSTGNRGGTPGEVRLQIPRLWCLMVIFVVATTTTQANTTLGVAASGREGDVPSESAMTLRTEPSTPGDSSAPCESAAPFPNPKGTRNLWKRFRKFPCLRNPFVRAFARGPHRLRFFYGCKAYEKLKRWPSCCFTGFCLIEYGHPWRTRLRLMTGDLGHLEAIIGAHVGTEATLRSQQPLVEGGLGLSSALAHLGLQGSPA
jgi:hypothetical protein